MYGTGDYSSNFLSKSYMNINVYGSLGILIIGIEVHLVGFEDVQLEMHDVVGILHGALQKCRLPRRHLDGAAPFNYQDEGASGWFSGTAA